MADKVQALVQDLIKSLEKLPDDAIVLLEGGTAGSATLSVYSDGKEFLLLADSGEWGENDNETDYL